MKFFQTNKFNICFYPYPSEFIYSSICINIGSNDEKDGERGLAHFFEHMVFKGSTKIKKPIETLDSLGCYMNASTYYNQTKYYIYGNYSHYKVILKILIYLLLYPSFPEKTIHNEIKVVLEELRITENSTGEQLWKTIMKDLYKDYDLQYSKPVIGEKKDIKKFTKEKLLSFIQEKYYKNRFYLTICGKFKENELKKYLNEILKEPLISYIPLYKKIENELKIPFFSPNHKPTIQFIKKKGFEQNKTFMVFRFTDFYNKYIDSMSLLSIIIGKSHSSFLYQLLREKHGLTYTQNCLDCYFMNHGFIYIKFKSDLKNTKKIIELIWNSLKRFKIKEQALKTAKEIYKNQYYGNKENLLTWTDIIEEHWTFDKKIPTLQDMEHITLKEVQNLFYKVFIKENLYIYSIGDYKEIPSIKII